jgi:hypothetical protein
MHTERQRLRFVDLPFATQAATVGSGFMAWVLFAELVIDRHGLAPHLPFYRLGDLCVWDAAVVSGLLSLWGAAHARGRRRGR